MSGTRIQPADVRSSPSIERGDRAAARGDWIQAIREWEEVLATSDRAAAIHRIRWFMSETGPALSADPIQRRPLRDRGVLLVTAVVCALLGTASVLLGQGEQGALRNMYSAFAWLAYVASAALVVAHAFGDRPISTPLPSDNAAVELEEARRRAIHLATHDAGSDASD
jgi:hypothetical protein